MKSMKIVDRTGHSTLTWDESAVEADEVTKISQDEADARFSELINANFVAFKKGAPDAEFEMARGEVFDPAAHEYLMVPPMAGGA